MSANQQNDRFQAIFDELLHNLKGAQAWPSWVWVFLHKADPYG
jgi:hypothetical protein